MMHLGLHDNVYDSCTRVFIVLSAVCTQRYLATSQLDDMLLIVLLERVLSFAELSSQLWIVSLFEDILVNCLRMCSITF